MKTLRDLLVDADPLRGDAAWPAGTRQTMREAVLEAARSSQQWHRRAVPRRMLMAMTLLVVAAALVWPRTTVDLAAAIRFEVRLAEDGPGPDLREAPVDGTNRHIYLHPDVVAANRDITTARVAERDGRFVVEIAFTADAAGRMRRATITHLGRPLAILLDGAVVLAPTVRGPIGEMAVLTGAYTRADAERIAMGIRGQ